MSWEQLPELLRKARNGDELAWQVLVELAKPFLLSQASKAIGANWPQQSTSDLLQQTWQRAYQNLADFRGGPTAEDTAAMFRAWLGKILQSQWRNDIRAMLAQKRASGETASGDPSDVTDKTPRPSVHVRQRELVAETQAALTGLADPRDREVLRLYFYDGLSFRQIADELNITLDKVRTSYHRGLERLKDQKRLEELVDSLP